MQTASFFSWNLMRRLLLATYLLLAAFAGARDIVDIDSATLAKLAASGCR